LWECALLFKSLGQKLTRNRNPEPNRRRSEKARAFKLFPRH
jgi:hypothetical protein